MSAQPIPQPEPALRAACFTPLSYFERALDLDYTQLRCFGLILVETLGAHPVRPAAEIPYDRFAETFQVSKEWIGAALGALQAAGYIKIGRAPRGAVTYSICDEYVLEAKKAGRETIPGLCPDCHKVGMFSTEFIPTPHAAFRKLGGCVDSATFRCVMVVSRYTCRWDREKRVLVVEPAELDLADFTRLTGLEKREIMNGLNNAGRLGLIGREKRPGRPSRFWINPSQFGLLEKRQPRTVTPPDSDSEEKEKPTTLEIVKTPTKPDKTRANESAGYFLGRCQNCNHLVAFKPLSADEFQESIEKQERERPKPPPRNRYPEKKSKWEGTMQSIFEMYIEGESDVKR